jgi:hypothetical protein
VYPEWKPAQGGLSNSTAARCYFILATFREKARDTERKKHVTGLFWKVFIYRALAICGRESIKGGGENLD